MTEPAPAPATRRAAFLALRDELRTLRRGAVARERRLRDAIAAVHPAHAGGAVNLAHYLSLRSRDLRPLQARLTAMGLSSLGRMESDVLRNVDAVLAVIDDALGDDALGDDLDSPPQAGATDDDLRRAAAALLGGTPERRRARIMVTLPREAASEPAVVAEFAAAGMDVARINCAHETPDEWAAMAANVRAAPGSIPIAMDLAGPKLRTGPVLPSRKRKRAALVVHPGDTITLTADLTPTKATKGPLHRIGCTLREAFDAIEPGQRVAFDDGEIGGRVVAVRPGEADVRVTSARPDGTRLRAEKGINLPDTRLDVPALTRDDRAALPHVVELGDVVQLSFVRTADDVRELFTDLHGLGDRAAGLGIVVKIETPGGFRDLPEILYEIMRRERAGVMIARGDLAVEVGFARLAEVQEEILWLCEAARIPVIWATEVLDSLADTGVPTRAEVTDAAAGERAECVMLNKGPHIPEAIRALDDILGRMSGHIDKKRPLLRALRSWERE